MIARQTTPSDEQTSAEGIARQLAQINADGNAKTADIAGKAGVARPQFVPSQTGMKMTKMAVATR